jgi:Lrp/AsnC family transcriptional regulator for asnA, asnC and gidA
MRTEGLRSRRKPGTSVAAKIANTPRRRTDPAFDASFGRGPIERPASIDRLDRDIIEALQANGREPFRRIAAQLGVSEATVRNRYARLCRANVLQVTGVTNPLGLGFDAQAMIGVKTNGPVEEVADEVARWREASYVVVAAGQYDVLVELVCSDRHHLLEIINRIRAIPSVVSTESFMYLELWKQLYDWGTGPDDGGPRHGKRQTNGKRRSR